MEYVLHFLFPMSAAVSYAFSICEGFIIYSFPELYISLAFLFSYFYVSWSISFIHLSPVTGVTVLLKCL